MFSLNQLRSKFQSEKIYKIVLAYIAFFLAVAFLKHYTFHSNAWDLSIFDEAIWNTSQGRFMYISLKDMNYFGDHFAPILLFFVPFYWLGFGAGSLIFSQVVLVALGALPVYWLAKDHINNAKFHLLFPLAYLLFLPLWHIILFDFHPVALAIPSFLFAFYFLDKDQYLPFLLFWLLGIMCKENMPLVGAFFGLYVLFFKKKRFLGGILTVLGAGLFYAELQYIIPFFRQGQSFQYLDRYAYLGNSLGEFARTLLFRPFYVLKHVLIPDKILYVTLLTGAVSFLCFFSPSTFMLAIPVFAQNLLCTYAGQYGFHSQYNSGSIPFLFIAAIFGLSNLLKNRDEIKQAKIKKIARRIIIFFVVVSMLEFSLGYFFRYTFITRHVLFGHALMKKIPGAASVSASSNVHPHLTHRYDLWEFPKGVGEAEYVLIETFDPIWPLEDKDYPEVLNKLWKEKKFKKLLGFMFLGEVRTPARSKSLYQKAVDKLLRSDEYEILENSHQFLLARKKTID